MENISAIDKTIQRIENVGFCKEDYYTLEEIAPGIFKEINPNMLSVMRSNTKRNLALEAIDASMVLKVVGGAIAAGGVIALLKKFFEWMGDRFGGGGSGGGSGSTSLTSISADIQDSQKRLVDNSKTAKREHERVVTAHRKATKHNPKIGDELVAVITTASTNLNASSSNKQPIKPDVNNLDSALATIVKKGNAEHITAANILYDYCKRNTVPAKSFDYVINAYIASKISSNDETLKLAFLLPNAVSAVTISELASTFDEGDGAAKDFAKLSFHFSSVANKIKKLSEGPGEWARGPIKSELRTLQNLCGDINPEGDHNRIDKVTYDPRIQINSLRTLDPEYKGNELLMHRGFVSFWAGIDAPNARQQFHPDKYFKKVEEFTVKFKVDKVTPLLKSFDESTMSVSNALELLKHIDFDKLENEATKLPDRDWNINDISKSIKTAGMLLNRLNKAGSNFMMTCSNSIKAIDAVTVVAIKKNRGLTKVIENKD